MADKISELERKTFLTNSDAHSLPKIAREYNKILLEDISFKELVMALKNEGKRKIIANYGLDSKLGKYHRTFCEKCGKNLQGRPPILHCTDCDSSNITMGVLDRIEQIKDKIYTVSPNYRPPYIYQIPLTFMPGVGIKTINKLLEKFNTEMNILHNTSKEELESVVGEKIANIIVDSRSGNINIQVGGGGIYGKVSVKEKAKVYG